MDDRDWSIDSILFIGLGITLFLAAVGHHSLEFVALNGLAGPVLALSLDGIPALGIAYAGYRLAGTTLSAQHQRTVTIWALSGGFIFVAVIGASFLVRFIEGRTILEWEFPLLLAVEIGVLSGFLAGYYNVRAQAETERARTVSRALAFVNSLLRHDLRNDLITIQGQADIITPEDHEGDSMASHLSAITNKAEEALTRIETTRTVTDTVVGEPDLEPIELASVTANVVDRATDVYDVSIETNLPEQAFVSANDGVRSVIDNLLENAVEHNDTDNPQVTVDIDIDSAADTVRLTLRDNGPGIPDQQKERLLDEEGTEKAGGGLGIVKGLVEGYSGELHIDDNHPRGSVIVVELPQAERGHRGTDLES